eukprot:TRINITY_DN2648_c0_g1_i10.p2 TRINITY_DN2648_c0_g1~~TRINITY_DN2648_c0_g1_i10.p2  ORF type:complete len:187 (+),score=1.57 TRINITY_DN2648_c0_g1_i10:999-1559(+)
MVARYKGIHKINVTIPVQERSLHKKIKPNNPIKINKKSNVLMYQEYHRSTRYNTRKPGTNFQLAETLAKKDETSLKINNNQLLNFQEIAANAYLSRDNNKFSNLKTTISYHNINHRQKYIYSGTWIIRTAREKMKFIRTQIQGIQEKFKNRYLKICSNQPNFQLFELELSELHCIKNNNSITVLFG